MLFEASLLYETDPRSTKSGFGLAVESWVLQRTVFRKMSVCLSVCPSHASIVLKTAKHILKLFHRRV